jgi:hypothetical protein
MRRSLAVLGAAALLALLLHAPAAQAQSARGATATRAVSQYTDLEERVASLLGQAQHARLQALLAEEFTYRAPDLGDPLDAAEWLAQMHRSPPVRVYGLQVQELGELDLVSCLLRSTRRGRAVQTYYVVDAWRRSDQRLLSRYSARVTHVPPPRSRPDGRN